MKEILVIMAAIVFGSINATAQSPCLKNPCLNGGQCVVTEGNDFKCLCDGYYSGYNCEYCKCIIRTSQCSSLGDGICKVKPLSNEDGKRVNFLFVLQ